MLNQRPYSYSQQSTAIPFRGHMKGMGNVLDYEPDAPTLQTVDTNQTWGTPKGHYNDVTYSEQFKHGRGFSGLGQAEDDLTSQLYAPGSLASNPYSLAVEPMAGSYGTTNPFINVNLSTGQNVPNWLTIGAVAAGFILILAIAK